MMKLLTICAGVGLFAFTACSTQQVTQSVGALVTLADVAAQNNTTAAALVAGGAEFCGQVNSTTGVLAETGIVALATMAKIPVNVTNLGGAAVAAFCPKGTSPGSLPSSVNPNTVPVVTPTT